MTLNWDDLRYFLAVVRSGSTIAAARELGVNQTTVSRRIGELERALGATVFERLREGYRLTPGAAALAGAAETVEQTVGAFADLAGALSRGLDRIRVTTNEPLANAVLAPAIGAFRAAHPQVAIELVISPRQLDLAHGEADVALRAAPRPIDPALVTRRIGGAHWGAYCSRAYAARHGLPQSPAALADHPLLVVGDPSGARLAVDAPARSVERRETLNDLCVAVRAGLGVASLPCVLGDADPDFVRGFVQDEPVTPVWLIYHERLRGSAEVRAFLDVVAAHTQSARDTLRGRITSA